MKKKIRISTKQIYTKLFDYVTDQRIVVLDMKRQKTHVVMDLHREGKIITLIIQPVVKRSRKI
jgi:hypothetical protein